MRCTCTANSASGLARQGDLPVDPAVLRPVLRCVTWRTLISVLDQDRSINFCSFLTVARSWSCAALKILRRSRRTLPSWASPPSRRRPRRAGHASGSVHRHGVQLVPRFWRLVCFEFKGSPAHVSTPFGAGHQARYPASYPRARLEEPVVRPAVSCCLSAAGIRFLGTLSCRGIPPPSRSEPLHQRSPSLSDPAGCGRGPGPAAGRAVACRQCGTSARRSSSPSAPQTPTVCSPNIRSSSSRHSHWTGQPRQSRGGEFPVGAVSCSQRGGSSSVLTSRQAPSRATISASTRWAPAEVASTASRSRPTNRHRGPSWRTAARRPPIGHRRPWRPRRGWWRGTAAESPPLPAPLSARDASPAGARHDGSPDIPPTDQPREPTRRHEPTAATDRVRSCLQHSSV